MLSTPHGPIGEYFSDKSTSWYSMPRRTRHIYEEIGNVIHLNRAINCLANEKTFPSRPFILLTSEKTGSTWVIRKLATHPEIWASRGESIRTYAVNGEFGPTKSVDDLQKISWAQYKTALERAILQGTKNDPNNKNSPVSGFKLMYDQIPSHLLYQFVDWVHCNNVSILHLIRSSVIESYLSYEAQVFDSFEQSNQMSASQFFQFGGAKVIRSNNTNDNDKRLSNKIMFSLSIPHLKSYVTKIERETNLFRTLFELHPKGVHYLEIFYEELNSRHSLHYLNLIESFLGVRHESMQDTIQKVHTGHCIDRISNWDEVRKALGSTTSAVACQ